VHGPDYPAGVRTDIWHPALAEAHLKEKGLFSFKNDFSPSILGAFGFSPLDFEEIWIFPLRFCGKLSGKV